MDSNKERTERCSIRVSADDLAMVRQMAAHIDASEAQIWRAAVRYLHAHCMGVQVKAPFTLVPTTKKRLNGKRRS